jgi:DNA mismatch endonuclease (patch repair protein)
MRVFAALRDVEATSQDGSGGGSETGRGCGGVAAIGSKGHSMTPDQRRRAMRSNRGRTRFERRVSAALWRTGFRYLSAEGYRKLSGRQFPGSPDLIFVSRRCVVFVDGCFWHGCHTCHDFDRDLNSWWRAKIQENRRRDRPVRTMLRAAGWTVLVVREHDLVPGARFEKAVKSLARRIPGIRSGNPLPKSGVRDL